jgi:hypothetical protein
MIRSAAESPQFDIHKTKGRSRPDHSHPAILQYSLLQGSLNIQSAEGLESFWITDLTWFLCPSEAQRFWRICLIEY